jgi:hypothetical protein
MDDNPFVWVEELCDVLKDEQDCFLLCLHSNLNRVGNHENWLC